MPKVAVIIPARFASTRLPGKPLHPIAGKPLIQHVWERSSRARGIDRVIIATDDMRIAERAFGFGAEVAMTSQKHRSGTDRLAEVAKNLRGISHVINVQGDEPMVDPALITKLADAMAKDPGVEMITAASVCIDEDEVANPNIVKVILDRAGNGLYFSRAPIPHVRADGVRPTFYRHQGIYGYTTKFLLGFVKWKPGVLEQAESLEQLRALEHGARIRVILTKSAAVGVDTLEDVRLCERILKGSAASAPASNKPARARQTSARLRAASLS